MLQANDRLAKISGLGAVETIGGDVIVGCPNGKDVLTEKAVHAWTDQRVVGGKVLFVGYDAERPIGPSHPCTRPWADAGARLKSSEITRDIGAD